MNSILRSRATAEDGHKLKKCKIKNLCKAFLNFYLFLHFDFITSY